MLTRYQLNPLQTSDHLAVRSVYADAIENQNEGFYSQEQKNSWAALAWLPGVLDRTLLEGKGWISLENQTVAAFAVRYPLNHLALLYCHSRFLRRGHATALMDRVEAEAFEEGQTDILTEASFFSYPLLIRRGWKLLDPETIQIGGVSFDRYRMKKTF